MMSILAKSCSWMSDRIFIVPVVMLLTLGACASREHSKQESPDVDRTTVVPAAKRLVR